MLTTPPPPKNHSPYQKTLLDLQRTYINIVKKTFTQILTTKHVDNLKSTIHFRHKLQNVASACIVLGCKMQRPYMYVIRHKELTW